MKLTTIGNHAIAGNNHLAIVISLDDPRKTYTFSAWTYYRNGQDITAFDRAVAFAAPKVIDLTCWGQAFECYFDIAQDPRCIVSYVTLIRRVTYGCWPVLKAATTPEK